MGADEPKPLGDLQSFENEWLEVEVKSSLPVVAIPAFLRDPLPSQQLESHGNFCLSTHSTSNIFHTNEICDKNIKVPDQDNLLNTKKRYNSVL